MVVLRARLVGFMIHPCPSCCFDTIALIPESTCSRWRTARGGGRPASIRRRASRRWLPDLDPVNGVAEGPSRPGSGHERRGGGLPGLDQRGGGFSASIWPRAAWKRPLVLDLANGGQRQLVLVFPL